ncbi:ATP-dependent DNA helicase 2 subunit KU80 [Glycine max]|nr:ATP-dependent DNA helicase 2 subunit KU80 [Glycine max]
MLVLDAVIVGKDMERNVCLITNAQCRIKEFDEGTKEEQVTTIAKQMTAHGIKMESIIMRGKLSQDANKGIMDENDRLLNIFSKETSTRLLYVENPISLFGALRTRNGAPVTVLGGHLEINPTLSIKKKTTEEKFPSMKKYSDKAPPKDKFGKHEVKIDYEHKSSKDPDKVVPPNQRIKGYPYGPQIVPISFAEWEAVKFKPEKGVRLMGFTYSSNRFYMKDVYVSLPKPGNTRAMIAVSAVARAMKEMNKVAILDLAPHGQEEVLLPDFTPNPVLERFYHYLELKSKDPDVAVPPLDDTLKKITEPDADLLLQNKSEIDSFCRSFELKGNPLRSFSNDEEVKGNITAQPANLTGNASVKVGKIGDLTPVQCFEALI